MHVKPWVLIQWNSISSIDDTGWTIEAVLRDPPSRYRRIILWNVDKERDKDMINWSIWLEYLYSHLWSMSGSQAIIF